MRRRSSAAPNCSSTPTSSRSNYSAFIRGSSSLEAELRARGITAVWVGGTSTNTCCESTARDAMLLDFRTTMISDANADHNDAEHNATLINFAINFGDVASTDDLIGRLRSPAVPAAFRL